MNNARRFCESGDRLDHHRGRFADPAASARRERLRNSNSTAKTSFLHRTGFRMIETKARFRSEKRQTRSGQDQQQQYLRLDRLYYSVSLLLL